MSEHVFEGVKVVDFGWVAVGPYSTAFLARHGATVVRVESISRPDTLRSTGPYKDGIPGVDRSVFFANANANKYGATLNLTHPKALNIAMRLVEWADVVTSAFTPGVMENWGLSYEAISKVKPEIIMMSTCMQGQTGPHKLYRGYGVQMGALSGFYYVTGWPDREPTILFGAYTDYINLRYTAALLMSALEYRRRTGKGQYIDQSQFEGSLQYFAPPLLDYIVNDRIMERMGNRDPNAAPHGAFPCLGDDRWCAIAIFTEEEWQSFCNVIGNPEWTRDPKFATLSLRKENEDELEALVAEWTKGQKAEYVMELMQSAGIAAGVVQTAEEVLADPQLQIRNHFVPLNHSVIGPHLYQTVAYQLSRTPWEMRMPAPCMGEHNEFVDKELLGMNDVEIADLMAEGVLE